jgi:hypothetical protein
LAVLDKDLDGKELTPASLAALMIGSPDFQRR